MKRALKLMLGLAAAYLLLMLGTGLAAKVMLSGGRMQALLATLQEGAPVQVSASGGDFDLIAWFFFRPAVTIQDVTVSNPPGFSPGPVLAAPQVSAQVAFFSLFSERPQVRSVLLQSPQLNLETDRAGRTNAEVLLAGLSRAGTAAAKEPAPPSGGGLAIDHFALRSGTIRYLEPGRTEPTVTIQDLDVTLSDFGADRSSRIVLAARLFQGESSRLDFTGRAGPASEASLPAQGAFTMQVAPAEIPAAQRTRYFGDLLGDPPANARLHLEAALEGDLRDGLKGGGQLQFADLPLGRDRSNRLLLRGEAPLQLVIRHPLTAPSFDLETRDASLQLGEGKWQGRADVRYADPQVQGGSSGSISGVRIEQMLAAFTTAGGKMTGVAQAPEYRLRFAGRNAVEMRSSLQGEGVLTVEEGRIVLFDLPGALERAAKRLLTGETAAAGETAFTRFRTRFQIGGQRLQLSEMVLESPVLRTTGQGYITFDQELSFDLVSAVTGTLARALGGKPDASGEVHARVPVRVRGTVDAPQVYPDVGRIAVETLQEKAGGLLDRLLRKKEPAQ
jgi:uncharacterized protein involved in outer membrane biogenesis